MGAGCKGSVIEMKKGTKNMHNIDTILISLRIHKEKGIIRVYLQAFKTQNLVCLGKKSWYASCHKF